jgi:hypothetical protein
MLAIWVDIRFAYTSNDRLGSFRCTDLILGESIVYASPFNKAHKPDLLEKPTRKA